MDEYHFWKDSNGYHATFAAAVENPDGVLREALGIQSLHVRTDTPRVDEYVYRNEIGTLYRSELWKHGFSTMRAKALVRGDGTTIADVLHRSPGSEDALAGEMQAGVLRNLRMRGLVPRPSRPEELRPLMPPSSSSS